MRLCFVREKLRSIVDYWQCLENRPLEKIVIGINIFDQTWSTILLLPTIIAEFLYVSPGGRSGFVDKIWMKHVDIYKFRRFHDWEVDEDTGTLLTTVDWTDERVQINETRSKLDEYCSEYEYNQIIAGDPGDYLKEVAGHPISSGYNKRLSLIVQLWTISIFLVYFTAPAVFVAIWWRRRRGRIIACYIFIQVIPMILLTAVCIMASQHLMCAMNVIYDGHPVSLYLILFTAFFCIYQLIKFLVMELYVIEMHLMRKRKDYGFKRGARKSLKVTPLGGQGSEVDVEKVVEKEKKLFNRITADDGGEKGPVTGKMLAREILELGGTTEDESTAERLKKNSVGVKRTSAFAKLKKIKRLSQASTRKSLSTRSTSGSDKVSVGGGDGKGGRKPSFVPPQKKK